MLEIINSLINQFVSSPIPYTIASLMMCSAFVKRFFIDNLLRNRKPYVDYLSLFLLGQVISYICWIVVISTSPAVAIYFDFISTIIDIISPIFIFKYFDYKRKVHTK